MDWSVGHPSGKDKLPYKQTKKAETERKNLPCCNPQQFHSEPNQKLASQLNISFCLIHLHEQETQMLPILN